MSQGGNLHMAEQQWFYLTPTGDRKGPFGESVLLRMLLKRLPGVEVDTLCWCTGMLDWVPFGESEPFRGVLDCSSAAWFYLEKDGGKQAGPVNAGSLAKLFEDGEIDGLTLAWHAGMGTEWKPIAEISALRQFIQLQAPHHEDEGDEERPQNSMAASVPDEAQVFEPDVIPSLPSTKEKSTTEEVASAPDKAPQGSPEAVSGTTRSFVGDDGIRYCRNPATGEWEEAESGYESDDDEDGEDASHRPPPPRGAQGKRSSELPSDKEGTSAEGSEAQNGKTEQKDKKRKKKKSKGKNLWVYVSGLPSDITAEELDTHFRQVGVIAIDPETQQPKVKIYKDEQGIPKGDASISYVRPESVQLAIEILDEGHIRPDIPIRVQKAVFDQKGEQSTVKRRKIAEAKVKVARTAAKQALSWADEDDTGVNRNKALRIVVIKNMFHPKECQEPNFVEELRDDLESECGRLGPIEKMTIFERNPEGIVVLKFGTAYAAEQCVRLMNGRFFGGHKLVSHYWDGVSDYTKAVFVERPRAAESTLDTNVNNGEAIEAVVEEEEDEEKRLDEFGDYLDSQELPPELQLEVADE